MFHTVLWYTLYIQFIRFLWQYINQVMYEYLLDKWILCHDSTTSQVAVSRRIFLFRTKCHCCTFHYALLICSLVVFFFLLKCRYLECIGNSMTTEMKGSLGSVVQKFPSLSRLFSVYVTLKAMKVTVLSKGWWQDVYIFTLSGCIIVSIVGR